RRSKGDQAQSESTTAACATAACSTATAATAAETISTSVCAAAKPAAESLRARSTASRAASAAVSAGLRTSAVPGGRASKVFQADLGALFGGGTLPDRPRCGARLFAVDGKEAGSGCDSSAERSAFDKDTGAGHIDSRSVHARRLDFAA